jgi:3-oxoacyl-[acyl-carrier-protein] synthase II
MIKNITMVNSRRVVVTGVGLATAFGDNLDYVWSKLTDGESAVKRISGFDASELGCKIAAEIQIGECPGQIDLSKYLDNQTQKFDRFIHWGIVAAMQAMDNSGLPQYFEKRKKDHKSHSCKKEYRIPYQELLETSGVIIGSGIGGLGLIEKTVLEMDKKTKENAANGKVQNPLRNPFFIVGALINTISGVISQKYGLKGPNQSAVTACATGAHAIADAARLIAVGDSNIMVCGGSEGVICKTAIAGFDAMRALSRQNDNPEKASCPWNNNRDGFVMGEGAGVLILEEYQHAIDRGAKIYAEIIGCGTSGDAYHLSAPHPEGDGGMRAMRMAMRNAMIDISEIDYMNAHGTSTPLGDMIELRAIRRLYNSDLNALKKLSISSTKSSIGHLLGAAGAVEAIFAIMAMNKGEIPPTINLEDPADFTENDSDSGSTIPKQKVTEIFDLTPNVKKKKNVKIAMSNSFGFGGTNASLLFKKI